MFHRSLVVVALATLVSACGGGGATSSQTSFATPTPTPVPTSTPFAGPQYLYVAKTSPPSGIMQYALPLTASSMPNFTLPFDNVRSLAFDASGDLAAADSTGHVKFFPPPLSATSTPAVSFNTGTGFAGIAAFNGAGDLFVTAANGVNVFAHPFTSASTPSAFITAPSIRSSFALAFDAAQNLYVAADTGKMSLLVFAPPYSGTPVITPGVDVVTPYESIAVSANQVIAPALHLPGRVDVYGLPLTAASTPNAGIESGSGGINGPNSVALDAAGNLYVMNTGNGSVTVYSLPIPTGGGLPTVTLQMPAGTFNFWGIAVGR
jgi:hypothetical protein